MTYTIADSYNKNLYDIYYCCVYSKKTPYDGQRNCPKHVEYYSKNKFEKLVHLVCFIIRIYHDERSPERQKPTTCTYLITPWCRVLIEQLTGLQLVKKFPAFHGTRRFITALKSVRHLSLSWASPIQLMYPHPTSWRSVLILSTHLRLCLPSGTYKAYIHIYRHIYI